MFHIFVENDCYYYVNEMTAKDVLEDAHDRDGRRVDVYDAAEETRYVIEREGYALQTFDTKQEVDGYQGEFEIEPIDSWVDRKCEEYNIQKRHTYSYSYVQ